MLSILRTQGGVDVIHDGRNILMLPTDSALAGQLGVSQYVEDPDPTYIRLNSEQLDRIWGEVDQAAVLAGDPVVLASLTEKVFQFCAVLRAGVVNGDLIIPARSEASTSSPVSTPLPRMFFLLFEASPTLDLAAALSTIQQTAPSKEDASEDFAHEVVIKFGEHAFFVMQLDFPVPADEIDSVINSTPWSPQLKSSMRQHVSHIACNYSGKSTDATEQFVAALRLAAALLPAGLCGLASIEAGVCIPADVLPILVEPEALDQAREQIPVGVWTGLEQWMLPDGKVWRRTRGFHLWGKPDLANLGTVEGGEAIRELFADILSYMRRGYVIEAGHTASLGDSRLKFCKPPAEVGLLEGTHDLLVVEFEKMN